MIKIMIHSCNKRIEYVNKFLVPFLKEQGYKDDDIFIYLDPGVGLLKAYLKSFDEYVPNDDNYIWHLQDDVLPRTTFYHHAEKVLPFFLPDGIICGFGNKEFYDRNGFGYAYNAEKKFYSFPCIRIPNYICHDFVDWFNTKAIKRAELQQYIVNNKFVDYLFKLFIDEKNIGETNLIFNYKPCLVDHVDEYCGGSTVNKERPKPAKAIEFGDRDAEIKLHSWFKSQNTYKR